MAAIRRNIRKHRPGWVAIVIATLIMVVVLIAALAGTASACPPDKGEIEFQKASLGTDWPVGTKRSDFTIVLTPVGGGEPFRHKLGDDGKYMFTLNPGVYTVSETGPAGVNFTHNLPATVTAVAGQTITVGFANTYTPPPPTGSYTIEKVLANAPPGTHYDNFRVRITGPNGYSREANFDHTSHQVTASGLSLGTYTVTEIGSTGNPSAVSYSPSQTFTLDASHLSAAVTVTNTWVVASFSIEKIFVNPPSGTQYSDYKVDITFPDGHVEHPNFGNGDHMIWRNNVPLGTYTIVETYQPDANIPDSVVYSAQTFTLDANNTSAAITVTNQWQPRGSVEITKALAGDWPAGYDIGDFSFNLVGVTVEYPDTTLYLTESGGQWVVEVTGLEPGTYMLTENAPAGLTEGVDYTVSGLGGGDANIVIGPDNGYCFSATVVNTYVPPVYRIIVEKDVNGGSLGAASFAANCSGVTSPQSFVADPSDATNGQTEFVVSGPGQYTISEPAVDHYTASYPDGQTVTLSEDNPVQTVHVVNTYVPPSTTTTTTEHNGRDENPVTGPKWYENPFTWVGVAVLLGLIGLAAYEINRRRKSTPQQL
jgi:hypothetical protein